LLLSMVQDLVIHGDVCKPWRRTGSRLRHVSADAIEALKRWCR
jgi:hypothetical protein